MPQMSPMWWTFMYLSSILVMFISMILMFFYKNNKIKNNKLNYNIKNKNWKW
uniref:ATP synthase F0 subunit 8 n=1 Tax=Stephanitis macaona TaxID=3156568 RepID=A0AAU7YTU4_9HEMI